VTPAEVIARHITCSCGEASENLEESGQHVMRELTKAGYKVIPIDTWIILRGSDWPPRWVNT
jgi:predicted CoA-binding protein